MNIAVIDDGVNKNVYNNIPLLSDMEVSSELIIRKREEGETGQNSHGTICAAIICKYAPNARITSIKVLSEKTKRGNAAKLIKSIEWCVENGIRLVNMSLGTIDYKDYYAVKKCINNAAKKGLIIVAACNNGNVITYPASFANTVGVRSDKSGLLRGKLFSYNTALFSGIEITACGKHSLTSIKGETTITQGANSFAAPVITALVHNIIVENNEITLEQIKYELWTKALNYNPEAGYNPGVYLRGDWIEKALIFRLYDTKNQFEKIEYQFDIYKVIEFECNKLSDIVYMIDYYGKEIRNCREYVDTLVIESYKKSNILCDGDMFEKINNRAEANDLNLMYVSDNDGISKECFRYRKKMYKNKVWHNRVWDYFGNDPYMKLGVKVPVILAYDFTGKESIRFIKHLRDFFIQDNYYCVAGSNKEVAVVWGIEYIPLEHCSDSTSINLLYNYYRPDIIIYGINVYEQGTCLCEINTSIDEDISILIIDEYNEDISDFINKIRKKCLNIIVLCKNLNQVDLENKVYLFEYDGANVELYRYIIQLFENDQG